ncbi:MULTISPECIES: ABC transporter ATP-binding protein [unclassified Beijerinckia]|uniref:ABC transporter ATP-binding protein n=1 Tax=unclassified Beijerinckia TaxID=2638183 RepID=UPI0008944D7A|nr:MULTISPECIES: ABC transporter ATP-binding protein [unclassified Beijerinckia]MDH7796293.1 branched-chain amino acid transport system ATP-binding protein [Beijerinckia sp. GAS462]SEC38767.1 amino acid/amide ABC transporter ATP-binding protein 1, HAAT family [Beijerinckia sp. 28-YEA-48]
MSSGEVALEVAGLSKAYGALSVTKDVSLTVRAGEAVGIIGPNGAGKTTLFNLFTGIIRADAGRISFFGKDITTASARSRCHLGITRSFQVPQPFGGMTVFENALVAAAFGQGLSQREARAPAAEALQRTGLWPKAHLRAGEITLLDRKRLELARSIATAPRLLLLDEIAGGLTESECHELVALIRKIHAEGTTIIWIEHVLHALLSIVDRVIVLDFGQKIAEGDPATIMKSPEVSSIYLGLDAESTHG